MTEESEKYGCESIDEFDQSAARIIPVFLVALTVGVILIFLSTHHVKIVVTP